MTVSPTFPNLECPSQGAAASVPRGRNAVLGNPRGTNSNRCAGYSLGDRNTNGLKSEASMVPVSGASGHFGKRAAEVFYTDIAIELSI